MTDVTEAMRVAGLAATIDGEEIDFAAIYLAMEAARIPAAVPDVVYALARKLYATSCALDPIDANRQPDWGRGGFKTEIGYWQGLALAALTDHTTKDDCPLCGDRTSFTGDPATRFCDKHYRQYLLTFQISPTDLGAYRAANTTKGAE